MRSNDKLPPQAVDLEEAVLGGCLLGDKEAVETMRLVISDRDFFYKPSHQIIYDAIVHLSNSGEAVDLLTVVKRLKDTHNLEQLGGAYYISQLTNRIATAGNMEFHCRIIAQQWLRRRMINICSKWYGRGFDDTSDVFDNYDKLTIEVMATLETAISNSKQSVIHIAEPVKQSIADYEERARAKGALTGVTSGIYALDRVTYGWQRSDMIIIAARPAMGKTALVLGFAEAAAEANIPVAFFSLEMSKTQLVNRMIVGKSQVNSDRFKRGTLSDVEVQEMIKATCSINELPIYIDDTPALSLANFARASRRLKKDKGIGLIIVDYLQLMRSDESKGRNREQEISSISRGLKAVAKELNVPIIALSQLSRAVESRPDKRPQLSDLRECISMNTGFIYTQNNVQSNVSSRINLLSLSKKGVKNMHSENIPKTKNIVYRVKTKTGRFVDATANHPILTTDGYKKVKDLTNADVLVLVKGWQGADGQYIPESKFIGWMLGNGSMCGQSVPSFITPDFDVSNEFCKSVNSIFGFMPKVHKSKHENIFQWDVTKNSFRTKEGNPCTKWLKENDLWGRRAQDKYIPDWFMEQADAQSIYELLAGLIETDGSIYTVKKAQVISYASTSLKLIQQIMYLFAKIGIIARVDEGRLSEKARFKCYKLTISDCSFIEIFAKKIKLTGKKADKLSQFQKSRRTSYTGNRISRTATIEISKLIKNGRLQIHGERRATQSTIKKLAQKNDLGIYHWLTSDDIYFDDLKSVSLIGEVDVFDRSVPKTNNFVVNGIVVHNSGAIEQDADMVMFIHRNEYYGIMNYEDGASTQGLGELIIAKHRNGAVDNVEVRYIASQTKFTDVETFNYNSHSGITPNTNFYESNKDDGDPF